MWLQQCKTPFCRSGAGAPTQANTVKIDMGNIDCSGSTRVGTAFDSRGPAPLGAGHSHSLQPPPPVKPDTPVSAVSPIPEEFGGTKPGRSMLEDMTEQARSWFTPNLTEISLEYTYEDLAAATKGFSPESRLGAGAAGAVYRGTLRGGTVVAVKVLAAAEAGFEEEVRVLSGFRHPHVVTLFGFGKKGKERYLVYELCAGGDLQGKLKKALENPAAFPWHLRLRVAYDTACGLSHMMNSEPKAFHRDIKAANILLDPNCAAKIADFGLAGVVPDKGRCDLIVDTVSGTPGYACPTYMRSRRVTEQSEVYSFGIVLLELLVNQPPALQGPQGDLIYPLLQAVQPAAPGAHGRLIASLDRNASWPRPLVDDFADLALACIDLNMQRRPLFEQIVRSLHRFLQAAEGRR